MSRHDANTRSHATGSLDLMTATRAVLMFLIAALTAGAAEPIPLWPKGAPGETGEIGVEQDTTKPDGRLVAGKRVSRIGNVSVPTITLYRPPTDKDTGAAVVVCRAAGTTFWRSTSKARKCANGSTRSA